MEQTAFSKPVNGGWTLANGPGSLDAIKGQFRDRTCGILYLVHDTKLARRENHEYRQADTDGV